MRGRPLTRMNAPAYREGALALFLSVAIIVTALGFEHLGGYAPCPLCLMQRYAYYAAIPTLFVALVLVSSGRPQTAAFLFLLVALAYLANTGLGVYHAGAEWKFWPGPDTCAATSAPLASGGLLDQLQNTRVIRCDEAAWRFLGLSFAGWNVLISFALALLCARAARRAFAS